jgi:E3 ubiquitin-protein ligase NEDD4
MSVLPACMSVHHMHTWCLWRPEEGVGSPGIGVTDSCELPCGCWELNSGPLKKQPVLLTTEPSLNPTPTFF